MAPDAFASHASAHPMNSVQPYRRAANLRKFFRETMVAVPSLPVTHPPRKSRLLPQEKSPKSLRHRFAARLAGRVNVRRARFCGRSLTLSIHLGFAPVRAARILTRRCACGTSTSTHEDFRSKPRWRRRHADQAVEPPRFFARTSAPERATCPHFAATRLKFAARRVDAADDRRITPLEPAPEFARIKRGKILTATRGCRQNARRSPPPPPSPATPDAFAP
jgi:hypothetical protein